MVPDLNDLKNIGSENTSLKITTVINIKSGVNFHVTVLAQVVGQ